MRHSDHGSEAPKFLEVGHSRRPETAYRVVYTISSVSSLSLTCIPEEVQEGSKRRIKTWRSSRVA